LAQLNQSTVATYSYNDDGERIAKTANGAAERYNYGEDSQLLSEYGSTSREYVYLGDIPVANLDTQGTATSVAYVTADQLGTPRAITDANSTTVWTWAYQGNPWGEQQPTSSGYVYNPRFPGQYYDTETALNYNINRDYDSATGRYWEADPFGYGGGQSSLYAYAEGDPLYKFDPLGLQAEGGGTFVCDGNGGFRIINNDHSGTRGCTQSHEKSHIDDFKKWAPNICKGKPDGYPPGPDIDRLSRQSGSGVPPYPLQRSECKAYRVSLQCDSQCPGANKNVERDLNQLKYYKCDAWGW